MSSSTHRRHDRGDERDQYLAAVGHVHRQQIPGRQVDDIGDGTHVVAVDRAHGDPLQLVVVELVRVIRRS